MWFSSLQEGAVYPPYSDLVGMRLLGNHSERALFCVSWTLGTLGLTSEAFQGRRQRVGVGMGYGKAVEMRWLHWDWLALLKLTG